MMMLRDHEFLSTPSARRATGFGEGLIQHGWISIHALREEGDLISFTILICSMKFLSTPSARRATLFTVAVAAGRDLFLSTPSARRATYDTFVHVDVREDFYPRPPRGGRPPPSFSPVVSRVISIHALREEGDFFTAQGAAWSGHFYPRPPRGGRQAAPRMDEAMAPFLSTPSARRATEYHRRHGLSRLKFLSTPSARRATHHIQRSGRSSNISIHALREEGDHQNPLR